MNSLWEIDEGEKEDWKISGANFVTSGTMDISFHLTVF